MVTISASIEDVSEEPSNIADLVSWIAPSGILSTSLLLLSISEVLKISACGRIFDLNNLSRDVCSH